MKCYKFLLPGCFEKSLGLPIKFCTEAGREFSEEAIVTTSLGRWKVQMKKMEGIFYFSGARWEKLVTRHALTAGDFIVFDHSGSMNFLASIFDASYCEKIDFPLPNSTIVSRPNITFRSTICASSSCGYGAARLSRLYIPAKIWKANNLHEKDRAILKLGGCDTMQWTAKLTFYAGVQDRLAVAEGWWEFCTANKIKEGDECIFHIINEASTNAIVIIVVNV